MNKRPNFLEAPQRWTQAQRTQWDDVGYASSLIGVERKMDWQDKLVIAACAVTVALVLVLAFGGLL
jgi:hypothetical protein